MSAQSTDEANSKPMITAKDVTNGLKQLGSRSAQDIALDNPLDGDKGGTEAPVTAPFPGGDQ